MYIRSMTVTHPAVVGNTMISSYCRFNIGSSGVVTSDPINDAGWHDVTITVDPNTVIMVQDGTTNSQTTRTQDESIVDLLRDSSNMFLGGVPSSYFSGSEDLFSGDLKYYKGCLDEVRVGGVLLPFFSESVQGVTGAAEKFEATSIVGIRTGCHSDPVCDTDDCMNGACVDEWNQFSCNCTRGKICKLISYILYYSIHRIE